MRSPRTKPKANIVKRSFTVGRERVQMLFGRAGSALFCGRFWSVVEINAQDTSKSGRTFRCERDARGYLRELDAKQLAEAA